PVAVLDCLQIYHAVQHGDGSVHEFLPGRPCFSWKASSRTSSNRQRSSSSLMPLSLTCWRKDASAASDGRGSLARGPHSLNPDAARSTSPCTNVSKLCPL